MTDMRSIKTIVLAVDGGSQQGPAVALAARLTRATGASLTVFNIYPYPVYAERMGDGYEATLREEARGILATASEQLGDVPHEARAVPDTSAPKALEVVCDGLGADLLVIGSCHRGAIGRAMLGSTAERLVHGAACPVVIAPRDFDSSQPLVAIGVGIDGSPESDAALGVAADLAVATSGELVLLGVTEPLIVAAGPGVAFPYDTVMKSVRAVCAQHLERARAKVAERIPATVRQLEGPAATALSEEAEQLDVLVVGSRGYGPVRSVMLGSVGRALTHHAPCPLVLVPRPASGERDAPAMRGAAAGSVLV